MNPAILLVLGGPHASAMPEDALTNGDIDIAVLGAGEYAMRDICNEVKNHTPKFSRVDGIMYKENGLRIHYL